MRPAPAGDRVRRLSLGWTKVSGAPRVVAQRIRSRARTKPPSSRTPRFGRGRTVRRALRRAGPHARSLFVGAETQSELEPDERDSRWNDPVTRVRRSKRRIGSPFEPIASGARRLLAKVTVWTSRSARRIVQPRSSVVVPFLVTTLRCEPVSEMSYVAVEPGRAVAETTGIARAETVAPAAQSAIHGLRTSGSLPLVARTANSAQAASSAQSP